MDNTLSNSQFEELLSFCTDNGRGIRDFQIHIRNCHSEEEKYNLITDTRDRLLKDHAQLELDISAYYHVIVAECDKECQRTIIDLCDPKEDRWKRFQNLANSGSRRLRALEAVAEHWGWEIVRHYDWINAGVKFCDFLRTVAKAIKLWPECADKMNQLMLRRYEISKTTRRRKFRFSASPIEQTDLVNVKDWTDQATFTKKSDPELIALPFRKLTLQELPNVFGFDKYGLMVGQEFAATSPRSANNTAGMSLVSGEGMLNLSSSDVSCLNMGERSLILACSADTMSESIRQSHYLLPQDTENMDLDVNEQVGDDQEVNENQDGEDEDQEDEDQEDEDQEDEDQEDEDQDTDEDEELEENAGDSQLLDPSLRNLRPRGGQPCYREIRGATNKPAMRSRPSTTTAQLCRKRCCPTLSDDLMTCLERPSKLQARSLTQLASVYQNLCHSHLQKFTTSLLTANAGHTLLQPTPSSYVSSDIKPVHRRRSFSDIQITPTCKEVPSRPALHRRSRDELCRNQVLRELEAKLPHPVRTHGWETDNLIYHILSNSTPPNIDESSAQPEAFFWTGEKAAAIFDGQTVKVPVIVEDQQRFKWTDGERPIHQIFRRMEDLTRSVSVQIPSQNSTRKSFQKKRLLDIQRRFTKGAPSDDPWNVLDLRSPLPACILPFFLEGENCQLLSRVRDAVLEGGSAERPVASSYEWKYWKEVQEWVLMSEGGHNTPPHMDSHGFATWITIQEGLFGFGWLSCPTQEEREIWIANPNHYTRGKWRYIILEPRQTIFFNSGTVHFVFRPRNTSTLALGGHILQWSGIENWIRVVQDQLSNPKITNETMKDTVSQHVSVVTDLITKRVKTGRVGELGGMQSVNTFFEIAEALKRKQKW